MEYKKATDSLPVAFADTERVGFEPTEPGKSSTVFKTASLNRSDTPPLRTNLILTANRMLVKNEEV